MKNLAEPAVSKGKSRFPEVDIDFDSFSQSSGDCVRSNQNNIQAIQKLLDELPLDCSTPKGKASFLRDFEANSVDRLNRSQELPKVIQVENAAFEAEKQLPSCTVTRPSGQKLDYDER